jgi:formate dehydrogenase iron-sulfur subunit
MSASSDQTYSLIDLLLAEQRDLTAVERFAQTHATHRAAPERPRYRELMPLTRPASGEQYAFVVDLDRCSGCKACVSACHSLNGLDEQEMWRSTGLIIGEKSDGGTNSAYQQTITSACHHCVDPACANGCPVLAYEKDADTGIVRHLDDQCIGCQYCTLKCPYDVPKYSERHGIVRKCDMCYERLSVGEAPACVQACPHEAIRIDLVNQLVVRASVGPGDAMIPGAFDSTLTYPTTKYQSRRRIPLNARAADADTLRLEAPHWPLIVMLLATQTAAGLHLANAVLWGRSSNASPHIFDVPAVGLLLAGLSTSVFHLGRPLKAWRSFLGWRRSWMSREIIVFGFYAAFAIFELILGNSWTAGATAGLGLLAVFCSAMIYVDTARPAWRAWTVFPKFLGTVLLLGSTTGAALSAWFAPELTLVLAWTALMVRTALFAWERATFSRALHNPVSPLHKMALTALRLLPKIVSARAILFFASTILAIFAIADWLGLRPVWGTAAFLTTLSSQILERYLFFTTVHAPRMPGGVPA